MSAASATSCLFSFLNLPLRRCPVDRSVADRSHSRSRRRRRSIAPPLAATSSAKDVGFHVARMRASTDPKPEPLPLSSLTVREALSDEELKAAAALRAKSFYVYPPEREFAGKVRFFFSFLRRRPLPLVFSLSLALTQALLTKTSKKKTDPPGDEGRGGV